MSVAIAPYIGFRIQARLSFRYAEIQPLHSDTDILKGCAMQNMLDRISPHNLEAERAVLGSMMIDISSVTIAGSILEVGDFYRGAHRKIFDAIVKLEEENKTADVLLLEDHFQGIGQLENIGGPDYLRDVVNGVPSSANVEYYAHIILDHSRRREVIKICVGLLERSQDKVADVSQLLEETKQKFDHLASMTTNGDGHQKITTQKMNSLLDQMENGLTVGTIKSGLHDYDHLTRGLHDGSLNIIAGLPGKGKSTLALNIALNAAKEGIPVGVVLLEGTEDEFFRRAICCESKSEYIIGVKPDDDVGKKLFDAGQRIANLPIYLDAGASQTMFNVSARAAAAKEMHGLKLLIVDYLQLIRVPKRDTIFERISEISVGLKDLAKSLNIPVLALSQFNREAAKADRPHIHQMRGSGQLEQDADTILILHDGNAYLDKNRNGPTGKFGMVHFPAEYRMESKVWKQEWTIGEDDDRTSSPRNEW